MNIILGEKEVPIITAISHAETINDAQRNIIELWTDEPLTAEDIEYIKTHDSFTNDMGGTYNNYKEVVRYSTWLAQVDPNAVVIEEKNAIIAEKKAAIAAVNHKKEKLAQEKEVAVEEVNTIKSSVNAVLSGRRDDLLVELLSIMDEWDANGTFERGDARKWNGHPYTAIQPSTSNGDMNYAPDKAKALWAVYHAKSFEFALPWIAPTHAEDIYRKGEFMIWTDDAVYECLEDTDRDPETLPAKWRKYGSDGNPIEEEPVEPPVDPEEPEEPEEQNSNGTEIWSEWQPWTSGLNSDLYQIGDRVTQNELRYIATVGNNHYEPASGTGWQLA